MIMMMMMMMMMTTMTMIKTMFHARTGPQTPSEPLKLAHFHALLVGDEDEKTFWIDMQISFKI